MNIRGLCEKGMIVLMGTWIGNRFGLLLPVIGLLILLMIMDYVSGLLASKKEAMEHPGDKEYGVSSHRSILGIYKKVGYMLTIFAAVCVDYLIYKFAAELNLPYQSNTIFGLLVGIWFVINEIISILENAGRMGTELPDFIKNVLTDLKNEVDKKS